MTTTTNLGLTTYDTASGSAITFLTFRLALDGNSSNMSIIDDYAGTVDDYIVSFQSNMVSNVHASMITPNYYEATVSEIDSYVTDSMIALELNVSNTDSVTININSLGIVTLKKVNDEGNLTDIESGDLKENRWTLFLYDGTYYVLMGTSTGDQINVPGGEGNLLSISGSGTIQDSGISGSSVYGDLDVHEALSGSDVHGLGDISLQSASAVNITAGTITPLVTHEGLSGSDVHALGNISGLSTGGVLTTSGSELSLQRAGALSTSGSELSLNATGITTGSYNAVDVNIYGQVTGGSVVASGGLSDISGSSVMSNTTGSEVRHNASGATVGSYTAANITIDTFGHITVAGNGASASSVGAAVDNPFLVTGSSTDLTNQSVITAGSNIEITTTGSVTLVHSTGEIDLATHEGLSGSDVHTLGDMSSQSSSAVNISDGTITPLTNHTVLSGSDVHGLGDISLQSASAVNITGEFTGALDGSVSGSATIVGVNVMSDTSGSKVAHNSSGVDVGSYTAANITVDASGHVTVAGNGISASSVGAAVDNPFLVTGSSTDLTNQSVITAGSNIEITTTGSVTLVHSTGGAEGLGDMSVQSASAVNITGGTITPLTDHTVLSGSDVHTLGDMSSQSSSAVNISAGTITPLVTHEGLSGSDVHVLGDMSSQSSSAVNISAGTITPLVTHEGLSGSDVHGLGNISLQSASAVIITGAFTGSLDGSISGSAVETDQALSSHISLTGSEVHALGDISVQSASAVNISAGTITPLTNHTVLSGSDVHGLGDISLQSASAVNITGGTFGGTFDGSISGSAVETEEALATHEGLSGSDVHVLGDMSSQSSSAVNISAGTITPLVTHEGLSGSDVHTLGDLSIQSASAVNISNGTITPLVTHEGLSGSDVHSLGDISIQSASAVNITGGTISSIVTSGSISFQIDQSGGTSDTYGILAGDVNGINAEYTVSLGSYIIGSLKVYLNGQLQTQGSSEDWVETTPASGTFTFAEAPLSGDEIVAVYQFTTGGTGNADTVDGYHATTLLGTTVVTFIPLNQAAALVGTETNYIRIPSKMNGYNLIEVAASCSGSSTSGSPTFTVKNGTTSMLLVNLMIDEGEYDSITSGCTASIDTDEDDVATGDQIWVSSSGSDTCGTDVTYAGVELTFQLP